MLIYNIHSTLFSVVYRYVSPLRCTVLQHRCILQVARSLIPTFYCLLPVTFPSSLLYICLQKQIWMTFFAHAIAKCSVKLQYFWQLSPSYRFSDVIQIPLNICVLDDTLFSDAHVSPDAIHVPLLLQLLLHTQSISPLPYSFY